VSSGAHYDGPFSTFTAANAEPCLEVRWPSLNRCLAWQAQHSDACALPAINARIWREKDASSRDNFVIANWTRSIWPRLP